MYSFFIYLAEPGSGKIKLRRTSALVTVPPNKLALGAIRHRLIHVSEPRNVNSVRPAWHAGPRAAPVDGKRAFRAAAINMIHQVVPQCSAGITDIRIQKQASRFERGGAQHHYFSVYSPLVVCL